MIVTVPAFVVLLLPPLVLLYVNVKSSPLINVYVPSVIVTVGICDSLLNVKLFESNSIFANEISLFWETIV